jgi:chromate transport protein ChrA
MCCAYFEVALFERVCVVCVFIPGSKASTGLACYLSWQLWRNNNISLFWLSGVLLLFVDMLLIIHVK